MDIQRLIDREALKGLVNDYFRGNDRGDRELVRACFHADARFDYQPVYEGGLEGFLDFTMGTVHADRRLELHYGGSPCISFESPDVAHGEVYGMSRYETAGSHAWGGGVHGQSWLRYIDRFERRAGAWRIARRRLVIESSRRDLVGGHLPLPEEDRGQRCPHDPIYRR